MTKLAPAVTIVFTALALGCSGGQQSQGAAEAGTKSAPPNVEPKTATSPHPPEAVATSADGVEIRYSDQGQGSPALVLVHGWSCDRSYWREQQDYFASDHRVVSIDLAGHGESSADREDWTITNFGEDVATVVRQLDLDEVILVGHSMGGPVVLEAARLLEGRVIGVIGVDTLRDIERQPPQEMVEESFRSMDADFSAAAAEMVRGMFVETSDPRLRDFVVRDMASAPPEVGKGAVRAMLAFDNAAGVEALTVPLTLINSDYQPNLPGPIAQRNSGFQLVEMSEVGHFVMMEAPEVFNAHMEDAIARYRE